MIKLYSYWRSSAAYRVRIALNLKALEHEIVQVSLEPGVSEHRQAAYRDKNPQMLVPYLEDGALSIGQSMAILEYLEEAYPDIPMLPNDPVRRGQVRAFCNAIACDIHPILNLRILEFLKSEYEADPFEAWYPHWIREGFEALEKLASGGPFVLGDTASLADCFLVPQMYNARRFSIPLDDYPKLVTAVDHCNEHEAFIKAVPENP